MKTLTLIIALLIVEVSHSYCQYWEPLGGGVEGAGIVEAFMPDTFHNKLFTGGVFNLIGGVSATYMAYWDGTIWHALPVQVSDPVVSFAMKEDTLIFITANSNDFQVGRYVDTVFIDTLPKPGGLAYCLYVFHDTLYAGGEFSGGVKYWNGTQWKKLGGGIGGISYSVNAIGSYNDQLIVGGHFSSAGGMSVNNIAAWDGSQWSDMGGGMTDDLDFPEVLAIKQYKNDLYAGGAFRKAGGIYTGDISKWNGSMWDTVYLSSLGSTCGDVRGLYVDDTMLYATGTISGYLNCMGHRAAMFDGTNWYNLFLSDVDAGYAITVFNGDIIAGTDFKYGYNDDTINYIAHFLGYPTTTQTAEQNSSPIFPNPTSTTITLSLPSNQNAMLSIFNLLGEKVKQEKVTGKEVTLDVSELPAGMYVVRSNETLIGKFVKE